LAKFSRVVAKLAFYLRVQNGIVVYLQSDVFAFAACTGGTDAHNDVREGHTTNRNREELSKTVLESALHFHNRHTNVHLVQRDQL